MSTEMEFSKSKSGFIRSIFVVIVLVLLALLIAFLSSKGKTAADIRRITRESPTPSHSEMNLRLLLSQYLVKMISHGLVHSKIPDVTQKEYQMIAGSIERKLSKEMDFKTCTLNMNCSSHDMQTITDLNKFQQFLVLNSRTSPPPEVENISMAGVIIESLNCIRHKMDPLLKALTNVAFELVKFTSHNKHQTSSLPIRESLETSTKEFLKEVDDEVNQCRKGEQNVTGEIRRIMESRSEDDMENLASNIHNFLVEKYGSSKKWIVITIDGFGKNLVKGIDYALSKGFHSVSYNDSFAAAVSVDGSSEFSTDPLLDDFRFPIETVSNMKTAALGIGYSLRVKSEASNIYEHFERHMLRSSTQLDMDFMVITTPCATTDKKTEDYVTTMASDGLIWKKITNQDECKNKQIIVVPKETKEMQPAGSCRQKQKIDHLYNIIGDSAPVYLSVANNSNAEGSCIVVSRSWKNETGQKWQFVNNTLRNDNGKCLTAWTERSTYLYQYDCHPDWTGQIWIRHGLQIVNGFRFCLAFPKKEEQTDSDAYAIQDLCDSTTQFLWSNWDSNCDRRS